MRAEKICQGIFCIILIIFLYIWYIIGTSGSFLSIANKIGINCNFFIFFSSLLFGAMFILLFCWLSKHIKNGEKVNKKVEIIYVMACICITLLLFYWFVQTYFYEDLAFGLSWGDYIRHNIPHQVYIVWMFICSLLFYFSVDRTKANNNKGRIFIALIAASIYYALLYAPAFYGDKLGTVQHSHAYVNSIINVMHGTPYSEVSLSIYGFYGIIYYPFVRLFGSNYNAIAASIALFGFVICFFACYIANRMVKRDIVYILCVLGIIGSVSSIYVSGQYYQGIPHRLLFPILTLAYIVHRYKKRGDNDAFNIGGAVRDIILLGLAITWNLETGMCCCAVLIFYYFILAQYKLRVTKADKKIVFKQLFKYIYFSIGIVVASVLFAYSFICLYNFLNGGGVITFKRFVYPFFSDIYSVEGLYAPLKTVFGEYWIHIVIYICLIGWAVITNNKAGVVLAVLGASGLTSLVYYMNRAASGNLSIVRIQLVISLGIIVDCGLLDEVSGFKEQISQIIGKSEDTLKKCFGLLGYIILFYYAVDSFFMTGASLSIKTKSVYDTTVYKDIAMLDLVNSLPDEKMTAVGIGAPDILYTFGLDTNCHIGDYSDPMTDECLDYMYKRIEESDYLYMTTDSRWGGSKGYQTVLDKLSEFEEIGNSGYVVIYRRIGVTD